MEEDGVVFLAGLECRHHALVLVREGVGQARVARRGVGVQAEFGQVLRRVWILRVLGWAATGDDEVGSDEVKDLVRVGKDRVRGPGEGFGVPHVDQGPGLDLGVSG